MKSQTRRSRRKWLPISTAPDGVEVLLWLETGGWDIGFWNGRSWDDGDYYDDLGRATHWMPLPEPPSNGMEA